VAKSGVRAAPLSTMTGPLITVEHAFRGAKNERPLLERFKDAGIVHDAKLDAE
jgi:hypothetical protein